MACRSALRASSVLRSIKFQKATVFMQSKFHPIVSRESNKSPLLSDCNIIQSCAAFHTSTMKMNENIVTIQDEEDFKTRVLTSSKPVIVDFFATWCGPCKLLVPRLEALTAVKNGSVLLAKIDIDDMPDLAGNYKVEAVPTVLAVKDGKVTDKFVGLKDDAALESFVNKLTAS